MAKTEKGHGNGGSFVTFQ